MKEQQGGYEMGGEKQGADDGKGGKVGKGEEWRDMDGIMGGVVMEMEDLVAEL